MKKKVIIEMLVEAEDADDRAGDDVMAALSECLRWFEVVNYTEDPPPALHWGIYNAIDPKESYFDCPVCGYKTSWRPEACPICHTQLKW